MAERERLNRPNEFTDKNGYLKPVKERAQISDTIRSNNELEAAGLLFSDTGELPLTDENPEILEFLRKVINNSKHGVGGEYDEDEAELLTRLGLM